MPGNRYKIRAYVLLETYTEFAKFIAFYYLETVAVLVPKVEVEVDTNASDRDATSEAKRPNGGVKKKMDNNDRNLNEIMHEVSCGNRIVFKLIVTMNLLPSCQHSRLVPQAVNRQ